MAAIMKEWPYLMCLKLAKTFSLTFIIVHIKGFYTQLSSFLIRTNITNEQLVCVFLSKINVKMNKPSISKSYILSPFSRI